jgi:hypothetical protein
MMNMHRKNALLLGVMLTGAVAAGALVAPSAMAQSAPKDILLFPAAVTTADGAKMTGKAAAEVQEIVTDATREYLRRTLGAGVVVYSKRLPSVQRALAEGGRADDLTDPGDNPGKTQRLAEMTGATEYLVLSVSDYKYDTASKKASFSVTAYRNRTQGNVAMATVAKSVSGVSAAGVATSLLEGSAIARAADATVDQVIRTIYPLPPVVVRDPGNMKPPVPTAVKRKERQAMKVFGAALGVLYFSTR